MKLNEHHTEILSLVEQGLCIAEIARIIKSSENGLRYYLNRNSITVISKRVHNRSVSELTENIIERNNNATSNKYCVYLHRRKSDNSIFYVGQGVLERSKNSYNRSKAWKDAVQEAGGFVVEVIERNVSKEDALDFEEFLIEEIPSLVNLKHSSSRYVDVTYEDVSGKFYYDETSPSCLRYLNDSFKAKAHQSAGYQEKNGYWRVKLNNKIRLVHRLVFVLAHNELDSESIVDHIDGNPANNKIENLKKVTHGENCRNRKSKNDKGNAGVRYLHDKNYYVANATLNGKSTTKSFSANKYGKDEAFRLACEWRQQMIAELNAQGAGYTERHGT